MGGHSEKEHLGYICSVLYGGADKNLDTMIPL